MISPRNCSVEETQRAKGGVLGVLNFWQLFLEVRAREYVVDYKIIVTAEQTGGGRHSFETGVSA